MNSKYRKTVIAGNWKMNKNADQAKELAAELAESVPAKRSCDVILCVPFIDIPIVAKTVKGTKIYVGAQNMNKNASGAYTGEISADMLCSAGVKYVIIGHSERRQYYGETDFEISEKINAALAAGLRPILCVGETEQQREQGITMEHIRTQVKIALKDVDRDMMKSVIIAYEPIWAIGTGKTATAEQANQVNCEIRNCVREKYGAYVARGTTILYGGSMNAKNAAELLAQPDIDGGLIGGASLKAPDFCKIIEAAL